MSNLERRFNTKTLYQQIADEFAARLIRGEWKAGQMIENEGELARSLGVSLGTVRKAFDILVDQKLLERHQGRGTVVPDQHSPEGRRRFSNIRDRAGNRVCGDLKVDGIPRKIHPDARIAHALAVNERTPVLYFRRTRSHEGMPFMQEDVYLRLDARVLEDAPAALENRARMRWQGVDVATHFSERVVPSLAGEDDIRFFGIEPGEPILVLERTIFSYQRRPLEFRIGRCHLGDRLTYRFA